jgi:hypothetical protein
MKNTILILLFLFSLGVANAQRLINPTESQEGLFNKDEKVAFEAFAKNKSL